MKLVILACLAAVAVAAPQQLDPDHIEITRSEHVDNGDGNFNYLFETENGISTSVQGQPGSLGQSNMQGTFSFPLEDGTIAQVSFIADENGYRAESPLIPVMPAHVAELLRIADEQRAQGITFDQQGRRQ